MYYDSHTHLNSDELYPQRQTYLQHFIDAGGKWLVNIGVDAEWNQRAIDIAIQAEKQFPDTIVKATIGYHPSLVCFEKMTSVTAITQSIQSLKTLYNQYSQHIVGIGECGIDTHYDGDPHIDLQKELFTQQCDLAAELHLPIVIHSRSDFASTFDVIQNYKQQKIYFHCRGYGPDEIDILQNYFPNLRIGFCGNISYPKAQAIRDSLLRVHPENIVFETDAPYLAPQSMRGQQNEPANVSMIYMYTSDVLSMSNDKLQTIIKQNFGILYSTI